MRLCSADPVRALLQHALSFERLARPRRRCSATIFGTPVATCSSLTSPHTVCAPHRRWPSHGCRRGLSTPCAAEHQWFKPSTLACGYHAQQHLAERPAHSATCNGRGQALRGTVAEHPWLKPSGYHAQQHVAERPAHSARSCSNGRTWPRGCCSMCSYTVWRLPAQRAVRRCGSQADVANKMGRKR